MKLQITLIDDRATVAAILVKNGYTVRVVKEKTDKGRIITVLEYWKDGESE